MFYITPGQYMVDTTNTGDSNEPVSDLTDEAGAPEINEIEVTPEMIRAGEEVIWSCGFHPEVAVPTWEADLAVAVYRAMAILLCPKRDR